MSQPKKRPAAPSARQFRARNEPLAPDAVLPAASAPPSATDALTTVLAAGIVGIHKAQKALFGGAPVPPGAEILLNLARAHLTFHYQLLQMAAGALDHVAANAAAAKAPPPPAPAKKGGG